MVTKKFVTDEYHEGQMAYTRGEALTTNPYLSASEENKGKLWYWMFGWQDAMADDVHWLKNLVNAASDMAGAEKKRTH